MHVIHGCAFAYNNKAVVIAGPSGAGKSETLNILKEDFEIISDDIVGVSNIGNKMTCYPGLPFLCVKQNHAEMMLNDKRKRSLKIINANQMAKNKYEIGQILFLQWGNFNTIEKVSSINGFKNLLANSFRPLPSMSDDFSEKIFVRNLSSITSASNQFVFKRKKGDINKSVNFLKIILKEIT